MEYSIHDMSHLFAQLGEPGDERSIARFIEAHAPLPNALRLHEADFWTPAQASFLCEAISDDADWAEVADNLNARLHARQPGGCAAAPLAGKRHETHTV